jgi:hypothetical protein
MNQARYTLVQKLRHDIVVCPVARGNNAIVRNFFFFKSDLTECFYIAPAVDAFLVLSLLVLSYLHQNFGESQPEDGGEEPAAAEE